MTLKIRGANMNELLKNRLKNEFKDKEYAHAYVNEFLNSSIATQIKVLREQRNLTQHQLETLTGMHQSRISVLENVNNNMWSISTLLTIAEAFDVSLKVSFEDFSTRIDDIVNFSRESLERKSRLDSLSEEKQTENNSLSICTSNIATLHHYRDLSVNDIPEKIENVGSTQTEETVYFPEAVNF